MVEESSARVVEGVGDDFEDVVEGEVVVGEGGEEEEEGEGREGEDVNLLRDPRTKIAA